MRILESLFIPLILVLWSSSSNGRKYINASINQYNNCDKWFYYNNLHKIEMKVLFKTWHSFHSVSHTFRTSHCTLPFSRVYRKGCFFFVVDDPMFHFNAHICVSVRVRILYFHDVYKSISQWKMLCHLFWIFRVHKIQFTAATKWSFVYKESRSEFPKRTQSTGNKNGMK